MGTSFFQTGGMMQTGFPALGLHTSIWALFAFGGIKAQRGIGTLVSSACGCLGTGSLTSRAL